LPLTTKRRPTIALLSKLRRPLNVIHGNARFTKFNRARGNSPIYPKVPFFTSRIAAAHLQRVPSVPLVGIFDDEWLQSFGVGRRNAFIVRSAAASLERLLNRYFESAVIFGDSKYRE
jgi:hypothetical protein